MINRLARDILMFIVWSVIVFVVSLFVIEQTKGPKQIEESQLLPLELWKDVPQIPE